MNFSDKYIDIRSYVRHTVCVPDFLPLGFKISIDSKAYIITISPGNSSIVVGTPYKNFRRAGSQDITFCLEVVGEPWVQGSDARTVILYKLAFRNRYLLKKPLDTDKYTNLRARANFD